MWSPYTKVVKWDLSRLMSKPTKWFVRPAKTQISLGIRPVWAESSLSAWRKLGSLATYWAQAKTLIRLGGWPADLSLRWAHSHFVGFVMRRLICCRSSSNNSDICWNSHLVIFSESFRHTQRTALCSDNSAPLIASEQSCDDDNIVCINGVWNAVKLIQIMQSTFLLTVWTCAVCFVFVLFLFFVFFFVFCCCV